MSIRNAGGRFRRRLPALLPRLRRFAHGLSRHADDLTQATVERALTARGQWQPGARLDAWLFQIMRNLWIAGKPLDADGERAAQNAGWIVR